MSIDTGNGGAAEKAHCWKESAWEANGRADEIVSALAAAVEGRRGDALRIAHAIGDGTVEAAVGLILRVPGMEQTSREAHQGIAREKAANERLRAEVEKLRGIRFVAWHDNVQPLGWSVCTADADGLGEDAVIDRLTEQGATDLASALNAVLAGEKIPPK